MTRYTITTFSRPIILDELYPHGQPPEQPPALADPDQKRSPTNDTTESPAETD